MSSFLCFICHSTVNAETSEETREKYREVVGMNLCPDSQLCHICCHILNKLSLFRSICLKRSLEYPVLFSEKGTINLHKSDTKLHIVCQEEPCNEYGVSKTYQINYDSNDSPNDNDTHNQYVALEDKFTDYFNPINTQYHVQSETDKGINTVKEEFNTNVDDSHCETNEADMFDDKPVATEAVEDTYDRQLPTETITPFDDVPVQTVESTCNDEIDETEPKINEEQYYENDEIDETEDKINDEQDFNDIDNEEPNKKHFNVILSVKEQKAELEARRKEKKYIDAEFKCYNCALPFLFKDTYQAHMMRHEESNGAHKCGVCALRFATQALLRTHERVHATRCGCGCARHRRCGSDARKTTQRFACHLCGNLLKNANGLQQHLRRVHASKTSTRLHACNVCGDSFKSHASLYTHMIKHINRKFPCEQCPAVYSSPYTLAAHAKRHTAPESTFGCATCSVHYKSVKALAQHYRTARAHLQCDRLLECPVCKKICPNQRSLTLHVQAIHSNRKDQACPHCDARYSTRKSLLRHIASHTKKPQQKTAVCHLCGNGFKDKSKLNRHLRNVCEKAKLEEQLASLYE